MITKIKIFLFVFVVFVVYFLFFFRFCFVFFRNQKCTLLYEEHERCLQKARNMGVPKAPQNVQEIREAINRTDIFDTYCKTNHMDRREIFLDHLYEGKDFSFCIFSSKKIIQEIEKNIDVKDREYFIDGTFKVVPYGCFSQLLIIHIGRFDTVHPFIYILMSRRTQIAYTRVFTYIDKHICSLLCARFTTDYESAMKSALHACFPDSELASCWFHFVQAIRKKASQMPVLFQLIRTDPTAATLYYKFQAIALLRHDLINEAFKKLSAAAIKFNREAFTPFVDYYNRQWIKRVCVSSEIY